MTSKWIEEVLSYVSYDTEQQHIEVSNVLQRIDALLKRAMVNVDSEMLYEEILKEIRNVN